MTPEDLEYQELRKRIEQAMWDNDQDTLQTTAGCICCCSDHTFDGCLARIWGGCRGGMRDVARSYAEWYNDTRGMSEDEFYGG